VSFADTSEPLSNVTSENSTIIEDPMNQTAAEVNASIPLNMTDS
jgi:hypothetical protein